MADAEGADRRRAFAWVAVAYAVALAVALATGARLPGRSAIEIAFWANVAATTTVFAFSAAFRNSSFYDPYWSVAPIAIVLYWSLLPASVDADLGRQSLVVAVVGLWGVRLTYNWVRGWAGLHHEDWRYLEIARRTGRAYWAASFVAIHMMPSLIIFAGCLCAYPAIVTSHAPLGPLDALATFTTVLAIWVEASADRQLRRFVVSGKRPGDTLTTGLWALCRHPNYLGEILFWWGLFLFAMAANPSYAWTAVGPLAVTLLFRLVSLPLIDEHMKRNRPDHARYMEQSNALVPRWRG